MLPYGFALLAANAPADEAESLTSRLKLKRDEAVAVTAIASMRGSDGRGNRLSPKRKRGNPAVSFTYAL